MLQEEDYSSDSDDADFVPNDAECRSDDSYATENECDESEIGEGIKEKTKRKNNVKKKRKENPLLVQFNDKIEDIKETNVENVIKEDKAREDDLWSDFLTDVEDKPAPKPKPKKNSWGSILGKSKKAPESEDLTQPTVQIAPKEKVEESKPSTVKVTKVYEFAGEEVRVEKEVLSDSAEAKAALVKESTICNNPNLGSKRRIGVSGIASFLDNKKEKLSTFQKTQMDWLTFKQAEDITEELETHKKSKAGYLDKQEFLQRADLRQYEIERDLRMNKRSKR